jgi:hypothetical protein
MAIDWKKVSNGICTILTAVYLENAKEFKKEAAKRKISVEQLAAAAITELMRSLAGESLRLRLSRQRQRQLYSGRLG